MTWENPKQEPCAEVGRQIQATRKWLGVTQRELSERLGISQSFLCQLERGVRSLDVVWLKRIAEALGCSVQEFIPEDW